LTTFSSRNVSEAVVPVAPPTIWRVLADADELTALTPLVRRIDVAGDAWVWHLRGISALGVTVEPSFTEQMTFDEGRSITFEHRPPDGISERAGASGRYELHDLGGGRTRLFIDISLCVELPLPRLSRRAVEKVMATTMQRTGDRFALNLYRRLGVDPRAATARTLAS
jgi:carbon monoxide dehydrogenase subunit G